MPVQKSQDHPRLRIDEDTPTGPPPAFQASLLEVEASIENAIRRIEVAREKARNDQAIRTGAIATSPNVEHSAPNASSEDVLPHGQSSVEPNKPA